LGDYVGGQARQTVERRQLGLMLQTLRLRAEVSQEAAAAVINRQQVRISQMENGRSSLKPSELAALLDFYGATEQEHETALSLGIESRRRQRRRAYTDVLPDAFERLANLRATATAIRHYEYGLIPGLLQTARYAESMIRLGDGIWWASTSGEADDRLAFRLAHQRQIFTADPAKTLSFVFAEEALRHHIGGSSVMQGQLIHLLELPAQNPGLSIQIIPAGAPGNPAIGGGGLVVLDFETAPRICFVSGLYGPSTYYDHVDDTEPMTRAFTRLQELALSPEDSRALLISTLKET
jgi:transcriptional regulator with XRE-family HTH domain